MRTALLSFAVLLAGSPATLAQDVFRSPPPQPFQQMSKLVKLPDFVPGLGQLFVDPKTLPAGPFLAYGHDGKLVSTIFMFPITDLDSDKTFDNLPAPGGEVDHVDVFVTAGHPGLEVPHAHIVLWHIPADREPTVAK